MSKDKSIQINGEEFVVGSEKSVLDACRENGVFIPTLCEMGEIDLPYGGCRVCLVEIETSNGTLVTTSCDTPVEDGMKVETNTEEVVSGRKTALELLLSEHTGDCVPPCSIECPASLDVQGYIAHIANGNPIEAVKLIKEKTPLALSLGRACFAPCEDQCRRDLVEEPIAIRQLKEFAAEIDIEDPWTPEIARETGKKIGIVGGGPAGLTAAYFLRLEGHSVKIYDQMPELGGMMRYGIPNYRLPNDLLRQEIDWITDLGIEKQLNTKMGEDITLDELRNKHDSVLLATGAWESWEIPIPGHELEGVRGGTDFLVDHSAGKEVDVGDRVVVVGCGGCAMDTARTAKRLGADVTVVYRRTEDQAPAPPDEIEEAKEEGIEFSFLLNPEEILGENHVEGVTCARMKLGEPDESGRPKPIKIEGETEKITCDTVLMSIGESPEVELLEGEGVDVEDYKIKDHGKYRTNFEDVFAAGDVSIGPSSIAESTGQGREAAHSISAFLADDLDDYDPPEDFRMPFGYVHLDEKSEEDFVEKERTPREKMDKRDPETRIEAFEPIEYGYSNEEAVTEAKRCLECGCLDRFDCELREYSDEYEAEQEKFDGFKTEEEIDNSDSRIERDPNKCVLCGSCVRTTEEVHGEGELQFVHRGFSTKVAPPFEDSLGKSESCLLGDLADSCPTGALEEVIGTEKPGPFEPDAEVETRCLGCGLTCPAVVALNAGEPLKAIPAGTGTYDGHLCDRGKFGDLTSRDREKTDRIHLKEDGTWRGSDWNAVKNLLEGKKFDAVLGKATTIEEARLIKEIVTSSGGNVFAGSSLASISTVGRDDLDSAEAIFVEKGVYRINPVLKALVRASQKNGAELVDEPEKLPAEGGVALLTADSDVQFERKIVASLYPNRNGLVRAGVDGRTGDAEVLIVWDRVPNLDELEPSSYETVVAFSRFIGGNTDKIDVLVPIRSGLEKQGTVINTFGEKIELTPVLDTDLEENEDLISNLIK